MPNFKHKRPIKYNLCSTRVVALAASLSEKIALTPSIVKSSPLINHIAWGKANQSTKVASQSTSPKCIALPLTPKFQSMQTST